VSCCLTEARAGEGEVGTWGPRALGLSQTMVIRERLKL